ncbi:RNA-guided endonuclease IscB [Streptomyces bambusae]|uniref:HNH endonuclease n=1 Tax=Streptomyces bambusae TaxID=1550616 RepID=A0ABS6ZCC7_9ACTN|nr:RNA-guided endonuclease IscB [Streptomyces bambusae]MBW5485094.1 HNH endonuclease [Streptomyces bambusae]
MFVLDKRGTPLQPTTPARARRLLKSGRAVVARHTPFVIRLKDRSVAASEVDGGELGIDPGSKHTGIAVFTAQAGERRGRYGVQRDHRGALIRKKLEQRAAHRRGRRTRNLRHRAPRFFNRARPEGWLAPSLRHRVDVTVSWVDRLSRWAPVRAVHVERVAFDTHAISADRSLEGSEYQHGTLHGTEVCEYLLAKFGRACVYCGATGVPRDAAAVQSTRWALWRALDQRLPTSVASGGRTKWNRTRCGLPKSHSFDALAVGKLDTVTEYATTVLVAGCTGRGTYTRTRSDKYGFPRLRLPRRKQFYGFAAGDLVRAVVPAGKSAGTHTGRVAVRASGNFAIRTRSGLHAVRHTYVRLLQRADGYAYTLCKEPSVMPAHGPRPDAPPLLTANRLGGDSPAPALLRRSPILTREREVPPPPGSGFLGGSR